MGAGLSGFGGGFGGAFGDSFGAGGETPYVHAGGGIGHSRKRKRYFLERDGNYLLFDTKADVERYISQEVKPVVVKTSKPKKAVKPVEPTVISKESLQAFVEVQAIPEIVQELIDDQRLEILMDIFRKYEMWLDEQNVEILLLH